MSQKVTCNSCKKTYMTTVVYGQSRCVHCGHTNVALSENFKNTRHEESISTVDSSPVFDSSSVFTSIDTSTPDSFTGAGGDFGGGGSSGDW